MGRVDGPITFQKVSEALLAAEYFTERNAESVELLKASSRWVSDLYFVSVDFRFGRRGKYWIKIHPDAENEYIFLKKTYDHLSDYPSLSIVRPVAHLEGVDGVVTEHASGEILSDMILRKLNRMRSLSHNGPQVQDYMYGCGKWLAALHSDRLSGHEAFRVEELLEYISERIEMLVQAGAIRREMAGRILRAMEKEVPLVHSDDLIRMRTHGDFAPYNVLVYESELVVHDCDAAGYFRGLENYCPRYDDLVRFFGFTLEMSKVIVSKRVRRTLAGEFLRGYNDHTNLTVVRSSSAFKLFELKYRLLGIFDVSSNVSRLIGKRGRAALFRRWFTEIFDA